MTHDIMIIFFCCSVFNILSVVEKVYNAILITFHKMGIVIFPSCGCREIKQYSIKKSPLNLTYISYMTMTSCNLNHAIIQYVRHLLIFRKLKKCISVSELFWGNKTSTFLFHSNVCTLFIIYNYNILFILSF